MEVGRYVQYSELDQYQTKLLHAASEVMETAYAPYMNFYVGAALLSLDGKIFSASNVENSSVGLTICAERAAIVKANSEGVRKFEKLAISARSKYFDTTDVIDPCGACNQVLYESSQISGRNLELILSTTNMDKILLSTIKENHPRGFGPKDVGIDISEYQ